MSSFGRDDDLDDGRSADEVDAEIRRAIYRTFGEGRVPRRSALARSLRVSNVETRRSFDRLAAAGVIVVHPMTAEVIMALPFAAVPTAFRVQSADLTWWAPSALDALGIGAATGRDVKVTTTCADCQAPLTVDLREGALVDPAVAVAQFLVPPARWADDILHACATNRLFRAEDHVDRRAQMDGQPRGAIVALPQLWALARGWYFDRLSPSWEPRPPSAFQAVLERAGLTDPFWSLTG